MLTQMMRKSPFCRRVYNFLRLRWHTSKAWRAGWQLKLVQNKLDAVRSQDIILFCCLRNEQFRMPYFAEYYRNLGVKHFLVVDNGSTDSFPEWAAKQPDFSVWHTTASYRDSRFGMLWLNDLLRRYGTEHWCVVVDPDEFLVYPRMKTRSLYALASFLEEERRSSFHSILLDAYSDKPLEETILEEGANPFTVCPFIDSDGYIQVTGWGGGIWIRGGPRLRVYNYNSPENAPALNKIPFIKWQRNFYYRFSTYDTWPYYLNEPHAHGKVSPTGALFHFKMVASLLDKAAEEMKRGEHFSSYREHARYLEQNEKSCYHESDLSIEYKNPAQLVKLGLLSPGKWF